MLREFFERLAQRIRPGAREVGYAGAGRDSSENVDGVSATRDDDWSGGPSLADAPVAYVPPVDDGRPRT